MIFDELIKETINDVKIKFELSEFLGISATILIVMFLYNSHKSFSNKGKLITIFLIFLILIKINYNLEKNEKFTNLRSDVKSIYSELNTGDLVLYKCYSNHCFSYFYILKILLPFFQENHFTHIGMIYKNNDGKIYILECGGTTFYCNYQNKIVDDGVMMVDFKDRIEKAKNYRIHIVKTNIHKYINIEKLKNSIEKYKNYSLNDINCIDYVTRILYDSNVLKLPKGILNHYLFDDLLNKSNYNIDIQFEKPIIIKDY
jgi:hypothetical protein